MSSPPLDPIALFDPGRALAAAWEWRFHFEVHWGEHLVGLERALYGASRRGVTS